MSKCYRSLLLTAFALAVLPGLALAAVLGTGRLSNVTPVDGGCVFGPTGIAAEAWDIEPGKTYTLTLINVTDCANGGTDATIDVRVNNADAGNTDLVATKGVDGTYTFNYTAPLTSACTSVIFYCTTPGDGNSGIIARRSDGGGFQGHLRAATFSDPTNCLGPTEIIGWVCGPTPNLHGSWGRLKILYR